MDVVSSLSEVPPGGGVEQRTPNETHIVMKSES